jgi:hypothetical protein
MSRTAMRQLVYAGIAGLCLLWGAAEVGAAPTDAPADSAVSAAITALTGEFEAHGQDPAKPLRAACDYFKQNPAKDVTAEMVVTALSKPAAGTPAQQAYVQWQLLSAVDGKFPDKLVSRVLPLYRRAPIPLPRPGLKNKAQLDEKLKAGEEAALNEQLAKDVQKWEQDNQPILAYRDELLARLPVSMDVLLAMLEDLDERLAALAPRDSVEKALDATVRAFVGDAKNDKEVSSLAGRLHGIMNRTIPYYETAATDPATSRRSWKTVSVKLSQDKVMVDLNKFLDDQVARIEAAAKAERIRKAEARKAEEARRAAENAKRNGGGNTGGGRLPPINRPPIGGGGGGGPIGL